RPAGDGLVPEAGCGVEPGERSGLSRRGDSGRLVAEDATTRVQGLDLVRVARRMPEQVVGIDQGGTCRKSEVVDEPAVAQNLHPARGSGQRTLDPACLW